MGRCRDLLRGWPRVGALVLCVACGGDDGGTAVDAPSPDAFIAAFEWRYPFEGEAFVPLKLTASGLSREITGAAFSPAPPARPRFLEALGQAV